MGCTQLQIRLWICIIIQQVSVQYRLARQLKVHKDAHKSSRPQVWVRVKQIICLWSTSYHHTFPKHLFFFLTTESLWVAPNWVIGPGNKTQPERRQQSCSGGGDSEYQERSRLGSWCRALRVCTVYISSQSSLWLSCTLKEKEGLLATLTVIMS